MANVKELRKELFTNSKYFEIDAFDGCSGDINDIISELCDNNTPIYTSDLEDFVSDYQNWQYIENANSELGQASNFEQEVIQGYYMMLEEDLQENYEDMLKYKFYVELEELTQEINQEQEFFIYNIRWWDIERLEELQDLANECFELSPLGKLEKVLDDEITMGNFEEKAQEVKALIEESKEDNDTLATIYREVTQHIEGNKWAIYDFVLFFLTSGLYTINFEDFELLVKDLKEDFTSEEERKELEKQLIAYEQEKATSEEIEHLDCVSD